MPIGLRKTSAAALPALALGAALLIALTARCTLLFLFSIDIPNFLAILFAFLRVTLREGLGILLSRERSYKARVAGPLFCERGVGPERKPFMVQHLIIHFPVNDFLEWCKSFCETFHIIGSEEHGIRAAKDPLVRGFICPCRGVIRVWGLGGPSTNSFSQANIIPRATSDVCKKVAETWDKIGAEPYIGFESYNKTFWTCGGCCNSGGKVHSQTDFSAGQVSCLKGEARCSAG